MATGHTDKSYENFTENASLLNKIIWQEINISSINSLLHLFLNISTQKLKSQNSKFFKHLIHFNPNFDFLQNTNRRKVNLQISHTYFS